MKEKERQRIADVLKYREKKVNAATLRKCYKLWRKGQNPPIADRCDDPNCHFHLNTLIWNGKALPLILDHSNGVNSDNRPKNLRFLCPNCDAQNGTRGGSNRGKTIKSAGGFARVRPDGKRDYTLPIEPLIIPTKIRG